MENLAGIRGQVNKMAALALAMFRMTFEGFMEHDLDILSAVLKDEERLNAMEKEATLSLAALPKNSSASDKQEAVLLSSIVADLEEIGDYIKDMIERIEIKIEEKLLFSDDALGEYKHLYKVAETELSDIDKALEMDDGNFASRVLCNMEHVDTLVQKYRDAHAKRLVAGVCLPRACNMFLNLLDFTAQVSHHAKAVAKNILELKRI